MDVDLYTKIWKNMVKSKITSLSSYSKDDQLILAFILVAVPTHVPVGRKSAVSADLTTLFRSRLRHRCSSSEVSLRGIF